MLFLTTPEVLAVADRVIPGCSVRDLGLIESSVARPQTRVDGQWAYADAVDMASAFVQSLVGNHALIDGNKRLGLACMIVFLRMNGYRLTMSNDEAYAFIYALASGELRSVQEIAAALRPHVTADSTA